MTAMKEVSYTFTILCRHFLKQQLYSQCIFEEPSLRQWRGGGYVCSQSEFQMLSFCVFRSTCRTCPCWYLSHLYVLCRHFVYQSYVTVSRPCCLLQLTGPLLKHNYALLQVVTENQKTYLSLMKIFCKESVPKRGDTGWSILLCTSEVKQLLQQRFVSKVYEYELGEEEFVSEVNCTLQ